MRIQCFASSKDTGKTYTLLQSDLSAIAESNDILMDASNNQVFINATTGELDLHGRFTITIQLTGRDIAVIAGGAFREELFGKVIASLVGK